MTSGRILAPLAASLAAGWCFFCAGPSHYAIIKLKAVDGWPRISSKRIADELKQVPLGMYDFDQLEPLLLAERVSSDESEDSSE